MESAITNIEEFNNEFERVNKLITVKQYDAAIKGLKAILQCNCIPDEVVGKINAILGMTFFYKNKIKKAIKYFLKAEKTYATCKDSFIELRTVKNSLGALYNNQREFKRALAILFESVRIGQEFKVYNEVAYNNIGLVYAKSEDHKTAVFYFEIAINQFFCSSSSTPENGLLIFINKATTLIESGSFNHARIIANRLLDFTNKTSNSPFKEAIYVLNARLNFKMRNVSQAKEECEIALHHIKKNKSLKQELNASILMSDILWETKNYNESFDYLQRALELSREIFNNRTVKILKKMVPYYEKLHRFVKGQEVLLEITRLEEEEQLSFEKTEFFELQKEFESSQKDRLIENQKVFNSDLSTQNVELEEAIDEQMGVELQMRSLQLQLSPHFIFNTLQSIQGFIFQKGAMDTSDYLAKFASLMRSVLNASKQDKISIDEEIKMLETYIQLEQLRFEDKFDFSISTTGIENLHKTYMPSLLVQPFIENAIIHGLSARTNGKLSVVFRKHRHGLFIHVMDNGIGRKASGLNLNKNRVGNSTALKIMKERQEYSRESNKFYFNYKILDRTIEGNSNGTHVILQVVNLEV